MTKMTPDCVHDIQLFGAMFILVGLVDVLIIEFFPTYALKLFGITIVDPRPIRLNCHPRPSAF